MENKNWIVTAAVLGALSVAMGAFGFHVMESILSTKDFDIYKIAVRYQMWHTLAIFGVALMSKLYSIDVDRIQWLFLAGIVIFSGSLYLIVFTQLRWMGAITPIGGGALILGWGLLAYSIYKLKE